MIITRPKLSEAKQIIIGCSDGSLRIYNYSSTSNKYIERFHYEIGQETIENNKTSSYNNDIAFNDKDDKIRILKWKSIKDVFRTNIIGLSVCIENFIVTIGYTKDGWYHNYIIYYICLK